MGELLDLGNSASTAGLIPYSALEYNGSGNISAISGSAIAGGVESSVVSSIVSSMVSGKADQSAVDDCCSAMSAVVSGKMDASASGNFAPSGDYAYNSSLSSYIPQSSSSQFAPSGDYAYNSGLSSYIPYSAVAGESDQITSINGSAISGGGGGIDSATCSAIASAYAESAVSGKQDALTFGYSGSFISSINGSAIYDSTGSGGVDSATVSSIASSYAESAKSGMQPSSSMSSYVSYSSFEYSAGTQTITAISGSAIAGQNFNPSQLQLVVDSANMSAANTDYGVQIGVKVPIAIVANSSQATANGIVYVVTG
jgi:hypothetical protein